MTWEEAIAILQEKYDYCKSFYDLAARPKEDYAETAQYLQALQVALSPLRPVSRKQVERMFRGCEVCKGAKYVTGSVSAVAPYDDQHEIETDAEGDFDFCPNCGRPLTDEAVGMVLERLNKLEETKK